MSKKDWLSGLIKQTKYDLDKLEKWEKEAIKFEMESDKTKQVNSIKDLK